MTAQTADRRARLSWMLYDWAAQPYHTLLITFIFAPYFVAHAAPDPVTGQQIWGLTAGLAGLVIALLAPVLGAMADLSGRRKPWIAAFSALVILGASLLVLAAPFPGTPLVPVLGGFAIGLVGLEFATVFTNAMMPGLVPRAELGKLSGSGWALGYIGGLLALVLMLAGFSADPETGRTLIGIRPLFGLDAASHMGDRAAGPFTALWYLVFVLPLFLFVPDAPERAYRRQTVKDALTRLANDIASLPRRRSYAAFLLSSMLYRDGLNALYAFGGIYAAGVLGLSIIEIGIFGILAALFGAVGAFAGGRLDARFGPRPVVFWSCWLLALACGIVVSTSPGTVLFVVPAADAGPLTVFYVAGLIIGAAGGALQAASRTLLVDQVEETEITEAFGLYALTGRATSFIGPLSIAAMTGLTGSQRLGVTPIVGLLALGAIGLFWVREKRT